jgi:hypothetical protein
LPLDTEPTNTPDGVAETQVPDDDAAGVAATAGNSGDE